MRWRFLLPALAVAGLLLASTSPAHDLPHGQQGRPPPPPTIDPGPNAALLRIRIIDAVTRQPVAATVCVNRGDQEPDHDPLREFSLRQSANRLKGAIRLRHVPYYFFADGGCEVRIPPGPASIEVRKGYEYRPVEVTLHAAPKATVDVEVVLERAVDMAALGWYSGDTHIHMERSGANDAALLAVTSAKDIRYAYLLSMNTGGYDHGGTKYESYRQHHGLGDATVARRGVYHIASGQEYRPGRRPSSSGSARHRTPRCPCGRSCPKPNARPEWFVAAADQSSPARPSARSMAARSAASTGWRGGRTKSC